MSSILHQLGPRAIRLRAVTSSPHHLFKISRQQDSIFWCSPCAKNTLLATKRYPATLYEIPTRAFSTHSSTSEDTVKPPAFDPTANRKVVSAEETEGPPRPTYQLTFTCKPCKHRSTHTITKLSYHSGAVLITCPNCKNRHIISDHLGIFMDKKKTLEEMLKEKGELVKKGTLTGEGDLEFWDDEATTEQRKVAEENTDKIT